MSMWRNYVTVGLRALAKNRTYAFINIFGLAIGMAACLMILLFVRYETSYDSWLPNAENTYQLQTWFNVKETGEKVYLQMTNYAAGPVLKKDFPQVEKQVYALSTAPVFIQDGQPSATKDFLYVDGNFLDVVQLPLVAGSARSLDQPGNAAMTESEAVKRFGTTNVLGRTMSVISKGVTRDFRIGAIIKDLPKNSHMKISTVARIDFPTFFANEARFLQCWGCQSGWVYVKLRPGSDPKSFFEPAEHAWEKRNIPDDNAGEARYNAGDDSDWHLVNVRDVHLGKAQQGTMTPGNDRRTIVTFAIVALLILGMAVVNFTNLATARASQRAREVALRKVLGASRRDLIVQFIGESLIVALIAMVIALALVELLVRPFASFLDADLRLSYFGSEGIVLPVIALLLVVGTLGGLYPALFLSRFQPATVLKANKSAAETPGSGRLRSALVIGQFAVSIGLIICTAIIYAQTVYARTVDPGYKRDHILQVEELSRMKLIPLGETIRDQVKRVPGVDSAGRTTIGVATSNANNTGVMVPGNPDPVSIGSYTVDTGLKDAMGLQMVAGRWFDDKQAMDDSTLSFPLKDPEQAALAARGANVVINELAAKRLGFKNPADAIGKQFKAGLTESKFGLTPITIVGVVKDSRFRSVKVPLEPIMFQMSRLGEDFLTVRYHGDPTAVRAGVERVWKGIIHDVPFNAKFSEDIVEELYKADDARAKTFAGFALLSVIVGCLGLFGLAAFTAERRTKEIGIRKVLGARVRDIVRLLVWQFSRPVLIANLIAWPVAWWVMRDWLNGFDARIALGPTPFIVAGLLALVIAIGTVAGHAIRVARSNPIHALRYE
jgi:putative ABC transport system permease protein